MALTDNLLAYWKMDEASGDAVDVLGSNNLTASASAPTSGSGKINTGRSFNSATNQYFTHADSATFSRGDTDVTFACWMNMADFSSPRTLIGKWGSAGSREYLLNAGIFSAGKAEFRVSGDGTASTAAVATTFGNLTTATWYFVVGWHDSVNNVIGISVNDVSNTAAHSAGVFDTAQGFFVGAWGVGTGNPMNGVIDEVGFWGRVLSAGERTSLYNGGSGLAYPFTGGSSVGRNRRFGEPRLSRQLQKGLVRV